MLFTFVLLGFVNSSCLTRNFEECLTLNVEYQDSCQLSQGECRPRPQKCTEIDATYPLNCRTNECYYSKRFNKCLSQPFTRLLNEVPERGGKHQDHQQGPHQGPGHPGPATTEGGPLPTSQQPPQQPPNPNQQPFQNQTTLNNQTLNQPKVEENETNDQDDASAEEEDYEEQDTDENTEDDDKPWNEPEVPPSTNSTNSTGIPNNTNSTGGFNDTYYGFQDLIEEEIKIKLSESDDRKQIEIKSSGSFQFIMAFITMIIWI
ncbi:unnamed protein product [Paramecium octaurelia]|uniref:Uncharacterized protein n=1 Tax=Paramecium octaurelia TaxID=43137 RepID=A0A8S1Y7R0_PAROT|nr:unnamed protein product [Paramecium octaurelia]